MLTRAAIWSEIASITALAPQIHVTMKTGCVLLLAASIRQARLKVDMLRPV